MDLFWVYLLVGAVVAFIIAYVVRSGILLTARVSVGTPLVTKPFSVLYKFGRGPYKNVGIYFNELRQFCPDGRCIGIYYDDPTVTLETNLRWAVGIIHELDGTRIVPDHIMEITKARKYKAMSFPAIAKAAISEFPFKTMLSILIAVKKVYPAMKSYGQKTSIYGYPAIEFYTKDKIHFAMPLADNEQFMVPECELI